MWLTLVLCVVICAVHAFKLPSAINKCSLSDPDFSACALKEARILTPFLIQGNRKLQLPPMDPLLVSEMSVEQSGNVGLNITLKNIRIVGLAGVEFTDKFKWDLKEKMLEYEMRVPRLEVTFDYTMKGRILILPISGQGPANVTLVNCLMAASAPYDLEKGADGRDYFRFHPIKLAFTPKKAYIELSNLFNGDPLLGPQTNQFLNDNWQEIIKDLGPSVAEGISAAVLQSMTAISDKLPYEDFFLP